MTLYMQMIVRFRWVVLALLAIVTAAAAWSMNRGEFASSIGRMFLSEHPGYRTYLERAARFGNSDVIVAGVEDPRMLSPASLKGLREVARSIERYARGSRVRSVLDVQSVADEGGDLVVGSYVDQSDESPESRARVLKRLMEDPLARGLFVSKDGKATAVVIELDMSKDAPAEKGPALIEHIYGAFEEAGFERDGVHVVGIPTSVATTVEETRFNVRRLFPIVCVVLLLTVWLMFRRFWPVFVSMTVALISVVWTMGFAVLLDRQISILVSMVPGVILIVSFSDVIHLCSAYLLELGRGLGRREAILAAGADVGTACLLTSATTFAGFISLSMVPTPVFRELGIILAVGVSVSLLIALTLVPVIWSFMPRPKPWKASGSTGWVQDTLNSILGFLSRLATRRSGLIVAGFAALLALAAWGSTLVRIETDLARRLPPDHVLRMDGDWFRENFSGANLLDVYVEAPDGKDLLDPERFAAITRFQDSIEALDNVDRVYSLVDLVRMIHREFGDPGDGERSVPGTRQALAQYLLLFEMAGGEDLEKLVDFDRTTMRITAHLHGEGAIETRDTGRLIEDLGRRELGDLATAEASGLAFLMGDWIDDIVMGQKQGLGLAIVLIAVMMMVGLRSVRVGLWSMIPNLLPLIVLGGYLGLTWDQVDSDLLGLGMIAIGIGVDDTVHFLMRYRIERERCADDAEAIRRTFHFSGRGIVITTVILVTGFAPFALSNYLSLAVMGTLLPMTLVVALAADVLLVPAMIRLGWIRFR